MTRMILDAGALLAWERGDRSVAAGLEVAQRHGLDLRTTGIVLAQVWRDPRGMQARFARLLHAIDIVAVDEWLGHRAGELVGAAGTSDPIDATVVVIAAPGDRVLTGDSSDITRLAAAAASGPAGRSSPHWVHRRHDDVVDAPDGGLWVRPCHDHGGNAPARFW